MRNIAVLGSQFGDEGKGRIVHEFSKDYDWVVRFSGGANAGHTIYRDGVKYVHNLIPSFDWRFPKTRAFLGSGMVINLPQLHLEIDKLFKINPDFPTKIYVDPDAFLVLEEHIEEDKKLNGHIGSTNRGIGPAYKAKIERRGIRISDALNGNVGSNWDRLAISKLKEKGVQFKHLLELRQEMRYASMLFEGAQGIMLDINHGTYPYVSCGDATVAGIYACGFHFAPPQKVYGVAKCYTTKVGEGPFPTEIHGEEAESLRKLGNEYGATTGRPRRIGWIDLAALKYACLKGGIDALILTKFDILNGMKEVKICSHYKNVPLAPNDFFNVETNFISVKGWENAKDIEQLTPFLRKVHKFTDLPISYLSCGTEPSDLISVL